MPNICNDFLSFTYDAQTVLSLVWNRNKLKKFNEIFVWILTQFFDDLVGNLNFFQFSFGYCTVQSHMVIFFSACLKRCGCIRYGGNGCVPFDSKTVMCSCTDEYTIYKYINIKRIHLRYVRSIVHLYYAYLCGNSRNIRTATTH